MFIKIKLCVLGHAAGGAPNVFGQDPGARSMMGVALARMMPHREQVERVVQITLHGGIGIFFHSDHRLNALLHQTLIEAIAHAAGNQRIDIGELNRKGVVTGVKTVLDAEFDQLTTDDAAGFDVINPELSALASMFGHGLAVLAGNSDLHGE